MKDFTVTGMSCAACQARVEKAVSSLDGVTSCTVSLLTNSMRVDGTASTQEIIKTVKKAGYRAKEKGNGKGNKTPVSENLLNDDETPILKKRLILSAVFLIILMYITMGHNMWGWPVPEFLMHNHLGLALIELLVASAVMVINQRFFVNGFRALFSGAPNMDTLVSLGSSVSFVWSTYMLLKMCYMVKLGSDNMALMDIYHNELYFESAAMIPTIITVGKLLEAISKGKTTNALKSLIKLSPKQAILLRDGKEIAVDIEEVKPGDIFTVKPGDIIPVDGSVIEGASAVDESALTGESIPVNKNAGDRISAATINISGYLICKAILVGEDTTLGQIIRMVSDAASTKAPIARVADKVSRVFVPGVMAISVLVLIGWLLYGATLSFALARAISVLVISCPCALGLATPVAVMVGNGIGAKNGILIKTGEAIETIGKIDTVVLDKTGTITEGKPHVTDIIPFGTIIEKELLEKAFALENHSEHPLGKAIVSEAINRGLSALPVEEFKVHPGSGLEAICQGHKVFGGNREFAQNNALPDNNAFTLGEKLSNEGKTPVFFAEEGKIIGLIAVADRVKESSAGAVESLKKLCLKIVMLTGDNEITAKHIGNEVGISDVIANVLPDQKESEIRFLQKSGKVAMVGDGINDAPALTRSDVGIAIGAGTDVAIDSAQIVLVNSDPADIAASVRLGRRTLRNVRQNLFWAFFYNLICIPLAAGLFGLTMNPMFAAAAMSLSSLTVCLNALRLNLVDIRK